MELCIVLISYDPFYETLKTRGVTEYSLIFKHGIDAKILHRMKHGEAITTKTLDKLCRALNCNVSQILVYKNENTKQ
jgi:DNA-binding Xre family transcriptional regulator